MDAIARASDIKGIVAGPDQRTAPLEGARTGHHFALPQALRGLAALWVVLFHLHAGGHVSKLFDAAPAALVWIFARGESGVPVFFALSGFVIAHSLHGVAPSFAMLGRFVLRRSIRLDPPYWAAILVVLLVGFIEHAMGRGPAPEVTGPRLAAHLFYAQNLFGSGNFNVVFWTLCYEVQFYVFFVLSALAAHWLPIRYKGAVPLAHFVIALLWSSGRLSSPIEGLFVDLWFAFYLGVLAYHAPRSRLAVTQMIALAAPILLGQSPFGIVALSTATLLALSMATGFVKNGLRIPPLLFLGTISYSLYLFHNPVTGVAFFVASKLALPDPAAIVAVLAANILAAWIAYRVIEAPAHAMSKRITLN